MRLTVAGPPDGQPPRVIEVDDPLSSPAELIVTSEVPIQKAGITKSEAREQAAIIQAQREEITSLRRALAETQDVMYKGKSAYNDVVQTKDMQIAQLYELAASGVRERARLRQELSEMQQEMQGTKRQLHAFMASLMQLKNSMDSAGDGDMEHALELLQASSWTASLQGSLPPLSADEDVYMQLVQMQKLSNTLVQDMKEDEELMQQGLEPRSRPNSYDSLESLDSMDSIDLPVTPRSSSLSSSSSSKPPVSSAPSIKAAAPAAASSKAAAPTPAAAATSSKVAAPVPAAASSKVAAPTPAAGSSSSAPATPRAPGAVPATPSSAPSSAPSTPKQPPVQPQAPAQPPAAPAAAPAAQPAAQPQQPPSKPNSNGGAPNFFPGLGGNGNSSNGGGGYYKTWKF